MKTASKKQLRRKLLCALVAGALAAPFAAPTAYALPIEGANAAANAGEANITTADKTMNIVGKTDHNILKWEDFSIEKDEKVRFDGGSQTRDYLNLVTGEGASNIYGTIEGGRNVYLVNPHGILFAKGSQVNTGALYLSTANPADIATATNTFKANGASPLSASAQMGDVLNLGTVKASKLYIEGKNVTVLNTDAVKDANGALTGANVIIRSTQTPHIGYDVGNTMTMNIDVNGTATSYAVSDYAHPDTSKSASARGWEVKNLGGTAHTDYDYMRVHTVYDLQNINAKLDGRYILAGDIDAGVTNTWNSTVHGIEGFLPLGEDYRTNFTGQFDGVGHTITRLHIRRKNVGTLGLFGYVTTARIENLSLVDGDVEGDYSVGGIVGYAEDTVIRNVSYAGRVVGIQDVGGIVGYAWGGSIQNAWNTGAVGGRDANAGGIVGRATDAAVIQNVCNTGTVTIVQENAGGIVGGIANSTLQHVWNTGTVTGSMNVGGIVGVTYGGTVRHAVWKTDSAGQAVGSSINGAVVTTDVKFAAEANMKLAATYTDWKDAHGNAIVATAGGVGTPWRIYNGHTMPLLTALMKGTKRLEKVYDGNVFATTDPHITLVHPGKDVGIYDAYSDQFGYDLIGGAVIKQRVLTMSGVAAQSKTYDGTTAADISKFHATLNNVVSGEESLVTATATGATYNSKDVRAANTVNYTGVALGGTGAGNYTLAASTAQGAGTISRRALTLGTVAAQTKTYDGTTAADAGKFRAALTNAIAGDSVAATATGATYNSKDVAGANTVNYTGVALGGADAGNYSLDAVAAGTGTITRRALTFDAVAAQTKIYDGNTNADAAQFSATLGNIVAGEENSVSATAAGATYNDKNVAGANKVSYTGVALGGTGAGNYAVSNTTEGQGRITPKQLTLALTGGARFDKTYDGTANVTQTLTKETNYSLTGFIGTEGDHLALAAATGAYTAGKDAGTDKEVTFKNLTLTGMGAGNYTLDKTALTGIGTIARRTLTLGEVTAQSKTYDGTTAADAGKFRAALTNAIAGDSVTATATGATYNDKNVAGASRINYTGVALAGADAGNYTLAATAAQGAGTITRRTLTASAVGAQTKTYDGTRTADAAAFHATLGNVVAGEENLVAATAAGASYNDKNVAAANKVSYTGLALTGTGAGNYTLDKNALTGIGTIAPRALTLGAVGTQTKTYDGNTLADASKFHAGLNNVVAGEENLVKATASGATYNSKDVATAGTVGYTGVALAGAEAGNYSLAVTTAQGAGTISRRTLTVDAVKEQSKTYDGTTAADTSKFQATLGNLVAGEESSVTATAAGAAYNSKDVRAANKVSYTGVQLTGTGAGNYSIANTTQSAGRITPKQLNLALAGGARFDKTYDGNANVTQSLTKGTNYTLTGFIGTEGDHLALASATGTYTAGKDARTDKEVTFKNLTLAGTGAGNYTLDKTALTGIGTITRRALTLGTVAAQSKTYDGNTLADASKFHAALNNAVAGDNVTAAAAGATYNDKNVAAANRIDYTGVALRGADAGNYSIVSTAQGAGTITHRELTLTAAPHSIVQGEALPPFTGRADGFADGEDASVFGPGGITFGTSAANTNTPGGYGIIGRVGGVSDGVFGNYRIGQAAGNATALTIHAAALPGGLLASLVQDAAPRFDMGFGQEVYVFGLPRPIPTATLGIYRFDAERAFEIQGLRL